MAMVGSPNRASINSATTGHSGSSNQRIAVSVAKRIRLSITPSANLDILRAFCASRRRYNPLLSQNHVGKVEVCVAALGAKSVRTDVLLKLDARGGFALGALFGSAFVRITATGRSYYMAIRRTTAMAIRRKATEIGLITVIAPHVTNGSGR